MRRRSIALSLVAVLLLTIGGAAQTPYYPPAGSWARKPPAELGMDPERLAAAIEFARSRETTREID
ncbi:MAG: serine hydrolase, partial [Acidobacteriota bacterium]